MHMYLKFATLLNATSSAFHLSHALDQEEEQKLAIRLLCCLFNTHAKKAVSETQGDLLRFMYEKYQVSTVLVQMQNMVY